MKQTILVNSIITGQDGGMRPATKAHAVKACDLKIQVVEQKTGRLRYQHKKKQQNSKIVVGGTKHRQAINSAEKKNNRTVNIVVGRTKDMQAMISTQNK